MVAGRANNLYPKLVSANSQISIEGIWSRSNLHVIIKTLLVKMIGDI